MALNLLTTLDKIRHDRRPTPEAEEKASGPQPILDVSDLEGIIDDVVTSRLVRNRDTTGFRTWTKDFRWPVDSLIGTVENGDPKTTTEGFPLIVAAALDGQLATIRNQQPNGDWRPLMFERSKEKMDRTTYLRVAVQWVDVLNKPELAYDNGKPVAGANVKVNVAAPTLPPEVLEALKSRGDGVPAGLNDFLAAQARLMNAQAAEAEARAQAPAATPKRGPGRPPKAKDEAKAAVPKTLGLGGE